MAVLDYAALTKTPPLRRRTFKVGPDGDEVVMRELSVSEQLNAEKIFGTGGDDAESRVRSTVGKVAVSLCNEDGTPMCSGDQAPALVDALMSGPGNILRDLMLACVEMNKPVDTGTALGNSGEITSGDSSSSSPVISDAQVLAA